MSDGLVFVRRIRRTPYSNRVEQAGVRGYSVYNHMILPKSFGMSVEEAYWHLREHVQMWDVSVQRQVEIAGPDAARLVQWMTPRDLRQAEVGRCYYVPIVDQSGGMLNDPVLLKLADDRYWLSIADSDLLLYPKVSLSPATSRFIKYLEAEFKNLSNVIQRHEQNELWRRSTIRR